VALHPAELPSQLKKTGLALNLAEAPIAAGIQMPQVGKTPSYPGKQRDKLQSLGLQTDKLQVSAEENMIVVVVVTWVRTHELEPSLPRSYQSTVLYNGVSPPVHSRPHSPPPPPQQQQHNLLQVQGLPDALLQPLKEP
jgi:hypothetical protein